MKLISAYLDTSVIGGVFDDEFSNYSKRIFERILSNRMIGVISELTMKELEPAPEFILEYFRSLPESNINYLEFNDEISEVTDAYLKRGILSSNYRNDAMHIAYATVYKIDILLSWNFKHIVNMNKIHAFNAENILMGYGQIEIRSPMEFYYDQDE